MRKMKLMKKSVLPIMLSAAMLATNVAPVYAAATTIETLDQTTANKYASIAMSNHSSEWQLSEDGTYYVLRNVAYCTNVTEADSQCMDIYVPAAYLTEEADGTYSINQEAMVNGYTADTAPIMFHNTSGAYAKGIPTQYITYGGARFDIAGYTQAGFILVGCGQRGTTSNTGVDGTAPSSQADLKAGVRYLKYYDAEIPGDSNRIITVGTSSGGSMSLLQGTTGDSEDYFEALMKEGAIMESSDTVYASQVYCPINELDHANEAYEWVNQADYSSFGGAGTAAGEFDDFKIELSKALASAYADYVNDDLQLVDENGNAMTLTNEGYGGTLFDRWVSELEASATKFLAGLDSGEYKLTNPATGEEYACDAQTYIKGGLEYTDYYGGKLKYNVVSEYDSTDTGNKSVDMSGWLSWDGKKATIDKDNFDQFVTTYANKQSGRMKDCPSFDGFNAASRENKLFGYLDEAGNIKGRHFDVLTYNILKDFAADETISALYAENYAGKSLSDLAAAYAEAEDEEVQAKVAMTNAMNYIFNDNANTAEHFRIRVGAMDVDTSYLVALSFALKLQEAGVDTDFAYVWNQGHTNADYYGELIDWVKTIVPATVEKVEKQDQMIITAAGTASTITKTYGSKAFSLKAKTTGDGALTYTSSDKKVATVSSSGKVTIVGTGVTTITVSASETDTFKAAEVVLTLKVAPKKAAISKVKADKKALTVTLTKDKLASGYQIQVSTSVNFAKSKTSTITLTKNSKVSATLKKLSSGKTYYVRARAYKTTGSTKLYGAYSIIKTVKVK